MSTEPDAPMPRDAGLSLAEVLVALGLLAVVGTLVLGAALSTAEVGSRVRASADVTGESRMALERIVRQLRQARSIQSVELGGVSDPEVSVSFTTATNTAPAPGSTAPEDVTYTYRWRPTTGRLTLQAGTATSPISGPAVTATASPAPEAATADPGPTVPVLAAEVTSFSLDFESSLWQESPEGAEPPPNAPATPWRVLDEAGAPYGNDNGVLDGPELEYVDLVTIRLVVEQDGVRQLFQARVDLRNRSRNGSI